MRFNPPDARLPRCPLRPLLRNHNYCTALPITWKHDVKIQAITPTGRAGRDVKQLKRHDVKRFYDTCGACYRQDHALVKEHFDHQKAETQREQMRNEIDRMKRLLENNDSVVHKQVRHDVAGMRSRRGNTTP